MIEGDVILQGQGTDHRQLIPVMGQPPQTNSDLTLTDWLDKVATYTNKGKGIKLDFSSIDAVEIALQRLREFSITVRKFVFLFLSLSLGVTLLFAGSLFCLYYGKLQHKKKKSFSFNRSLVNQSE